MASSAKIEIMVHKEIPKIMGFHPEAFIFSIDKPDPTKNKVNTNKDFDMLVIEVVNIVGSER